MLAGRRRLPAWEHREMVARLVREQGVVIVSGETGCGKSTQVRACVLARVCRHTSRRSLPTLCLDNCFCERCNSTHNTRYIREGRCRSSCWTTRPWAPR